MKVNKVKVALVAIVWVIYSLVVRLFYPTLINDAVVNQFENSTESFVNIQAQQVVWSNATLVLMALTLLMFSKEIKLLVTKLIKLTKENEEN